MIHASYVMHVQFQNAAPLSLFAFEDGIVTYYRMKRVSAAALYMNVI